MTTLDKLRTLHEEVCHSWRHVQGEVISEGEAEVLNLGFQILERFIEVVDIAPIDPQCILNIVNNHVNMYVQRVHSQFDSDADIRVTEVPHGE